MDGNSEHSKKSKTLFQVIVSWAIETRFVSWLSNTGLARIIIEAVVPKMMEGKLGKIQSTTSSISAQEITDELDKLLLDIARSVVDELGYVAAMVAPYEQGDILPARAIYVDPKLAKMETIKDWEQEVGQYSQRPISITDPKIAKVNRYGSKEERGNLSVRAIEAGEPLMTDEIYELFKGVAPEASRHLVNTIQKTLGIKKLIAVPFFIEVEAEGQTNLDVVGNLFVATKELTFEPNEIRVLHAFGQQAASAIEGIHRRRRDALVQKLVLTMQANLSDESVILQRIARSIVTEFGYVGSMVAPYESEGVLPVRAFEVDSDLVKAEQIKAWEEAVGKYSSNPVSLTNPEIARVHRYGTKEEKANLSVRAIEAGKPLETDEIYDLFRPIAPESSRTLVNEIQRIVGIQKLIAVPFFLEREENGEVVREILGNLFTATRSKSFQKSEIELFKVLGQQAAAGIRNARILKYANERQIAAQNFAKMAFAATAYLHELRNHIGAAKLHLQFLQLYDQQNNIQELNILDETKTEKLKELLRKNEAIFDRLKQVVGILDNLREPWKKTEEKPTDVNKCLMKSLSKVFPSMTGSELEKPNFQFRVGTDDITVNKIISEELPMLIVSHDMLTEAFRIIIKNAVDALLKGQTREKHLWLESRFVEDSWIVVTIRDTGVGIKRENIAKIWEYGFSTSDVGMGFGLYWAKDYIQGIGGRINVESNLGEGTTFIIRLPSASRGSVLPAS